MDPRAPFTAHMPAHLLSVTVRCTRCVATIDLPPGAASSTCVYCAAPTVVVNPTTPRERATHLVPFALDHGRVMDKIEKSLRVHGAPEGLRGPDPGRLFAVYVPAVLGTVRAHVDYAAEVMPFEFVPSDGVTMPHVPIAGRWSGDVGDHLASLSRGVSTVDIAALQLDVSRSLVPLTPAALDGWLVEHSAQAREQCREEILAESVFRCGDSIGRLLPGSLPRNLRQAPVSLKWDLAIVLLPVWVLAMPCGPDGSDVRRVLVDGASGRVVLPMHVQATMQTFASRWNPAAVAAFATCSSDAGPGHPAAAGSIPSCARCGTSSDPAEPMCPVCRRLSPPSFGRERSGEGKVLACERCGASVQQTDPPHSSQCPFCASDTRIEPLRDPLLVPELFVPFHVDEVSARTAIDAWISRQGWFRRRALERANLDLLRPVWWPAWIVGGRVLVSWATLSRQPGRIEEIALAGQVAVEITGGIVPASRGLSAKQAIVLTNGLSPAQPSATPVGIPRAAVELFAADRVQLSEQLGARAIENAKWSIPRSSWSRPRTATMVSDMASHRVGFPAWMLVDGDAGRPLRIVVSGQDPSRIVADGD